MLDTVEHRESFGDGVSACVGRVYMEGSGVAAAKGPTRAPRDGPVQGLVLAVEKTPLLGAMQRIGRSRPDPEPDVTAVSPAPPRTTPPEDA